MIEPTQTDIELNTKLLTQACLIGDLKTIQRLIPISNHPTGDYSYTLRRAATLGYIDIVEFLIPFSDPKAQHSEALSRAAMYGHTDIVRLLLPVSDPTANGCQALKLAAKYGNVDIIKLLLPVSDYQLVLQKNIGHTGAVFLQPCIDEYETLLQKERLHNTLAHIDESKSNNAKRKI